MTDKNDLLEGVLLWGAFWALFGHGDYQLDKRGLSLSKVTRRVFRTDKPAGKAVFLGALGLGAAGLGWHIVKGG